MNDRVQVNRLNQVRVEGDRTGAWAELLVTRDRHELAAQVLGPRAQDVHQLIAIHVREADIQKSNIRTECGSNRDRFSGCVGHARFMAFTTEEQGQQLGRIEVVIDDEDPPNL